MVSLTSCTKTTDLRVTVAAQNEVGCDDEAAAAFFRAISYQYDGTRPVTQNHLGLGSHPLSSRSLDVQGFSHKKGADYDKFHIDNPTKPELATECCSCLSQRGEDTDFCPDPRPSGCKDGCYEKGLNNIKQPRCLTCRQDCASGKNNYTHTSGSFYNNEISQCTASQVNRSDSREFVAGTFIWSGYDYLGESRGFPQTVKCRGTVADVAGFIKESYYWLRSWWFSKIPDDDHGKPALLVNNPHTVFIVEAWRMGKKADGGDIGPNRTVHVYSSTPKLRVEVNGEQVGPTIADMPAFGNVKISIPYRAGNLTAVGLDASGIHVLATHTKLTTGKAVRLRLSLDAPSVLTGTGSSLVADGQDTAMVRAELLDANGVLADQSSEVISFSVVSGDGRLSGTHSGDAATNEPAHGTSKRAFHGLVRAFVRSSSDHATPLAHRERMLSIDLDGGSLTTVSGRVEPIRSLAPIVVMASVAGLASATLEIALSTDLGQLPLAVAARAEANSMLGMF